MMVFEKGLLGYHHRVAHMTEVHIALHFFGKNVAGVYYSRDMQYEGTTSLMRLVYCCFSKVEMFDAFCSDRSGPVYAGLVIIVYCCTVTSFSDT